MINPEKMLYQENKIGANLVAAFILLNMFYTIMMLKFMPMTVSIGSFTMVNIFLSLAGFLGSTKFKVYDLKWGYIGIGAAVYQAIRFISIPEMFPINLKILLIVVLEVSALVLLVGSIITIKKSRLKIAYEQQLQSKLN